MGAILSSIKTLESYSREDNIANFVELLISKMLFLGDAFFQ